WVSSMAVSLDGGRIVSGGEDGKVCIWDAVSGDCLAEFAGRTSSVNSVAISPDGSRIVSGGDDGKVRLWDAVNGDCLAEHVGHGGSVNSVAISPDGQAIILGGEWGLTRLNLDAAEAQSWTGVVFAEGTATLDATLTPIALQGDAWKYLTAERLDADGRIEVVAPTESPAWERIYRA
ncbi:MAG: hypothetical protein NTV00_02170, partial [Methylococcales bacterium]|nr:hypothetical protein [Methylococcales bacterium]